MTIGKLAQELGVTSYGFCELCDNVTEFQYSKHYDEDVCTICYQAGYLEM